MKKASNIKRGGREQIGSLPVTEPGSFYQVEKGKGTLCQTAVKPKKWRSRRMRKPFSGDTVKPTEPSEDRQSWSPEPPTALPEVRQHMPAHGADLQVMMN